MAKQYINGYDTFIITASKQGEQNKTFNFSYKYEALEEYYEKVSTMDEWDDGSKSKIPHFVRYEWLVYYEGRIDSPDLLMWGEIENLEIAGWELELTVHKDIEARKFKVIIKDEKRKIGLHFHFNGQEGTFNKGYLMTLLNKDSITAISMVDPNIYTAGIGGTHHAPKKGQVQT